MFIVNERDSPHGLLVVITDKEIIGKVFSEGKLQLDLTKEFYRGEERSKEEVERILERAYVIHFTGEKAVEFGKNLGLIEEGKVLVVKNVPHAEVLLG